MEPAITNRGREADETDSVKVCVCVVLNLNMEMSVCFFFLFTCPLCVSRLLLPAWVCLCPFVAFVCFPIAPYLMRCKSSVKVAQLPWFIYASPSPPLQHRQLYDALSGC